MRITILAAAVISAFAQSGAQSFAGTWTADVGGRTYIRLELHESNGSLSGQITMGAVHFDNGGSVETVLQTVQNATPTPVFDVAIRDGLLSFARKDEDDVDRFEMQLVDGAGELTFLLPPDARAELSSQGISALRPIPLRRTNQSLLAVPTT